MSQTKKMKSKQFEFGYYIIILQVSLEMRIGLLN